MRNFFYILPLTVIFCSCFQTNLNLKSETLTIRKVTVAFSGIGCENECPFQVLCIDSSLNVSYYGGEFADRKGYFKGKIEKETWDSIQFCLDRFVNKGMDTTEYQATDQPTVEFFITNKAGKNSFKINTGKLATADLDVLYWFISLVSQTNYLNQCDSIDFETSIQFSIPRKQNKQ